MDEHLNKIEKILPILYRFYSRLECRLCISFSELFSLFTRERMIPSKYTRHACSKSVLRNWTDPLSLWPVLTSCTGNSITMSACPARGEVLWEVTATTLAWAFLANPEIYRVIWVLPELLQAINKSPLSIFGVVASPTQ